MKFEVSQIGNRIAIKTIKENSLNKVTLFKHKEAKTVIENIINNGWEMKINKNINIL